MNEGLIILIAIYQLLSSNHLVTPIILLFIVL